jgi:hypothetical protein
MLYFLGEEHRERKDATQDKQEKYCTIDEVRKKVYASIQMYRLCSVVGFVHSDQDRKRERGMSQEKGRTVENLHSALRATGNTFISVSTSG